MYYNYNFTINDIFGAYLRKSQADDPNEPIEITLSKHKQRILETAQKYNININQIVFYEEVVSGDTIAERPKMKELLNDINNNSYKGVFVVAVDRFSRGDSIDQGIVNNSFYYSNTLIITPDKIFDIANNEMDREQLEFGLFMSKREYNLIKRRMYQGRLDNVKKGLFVGSTPPFGYDKIKTEEKGYILVPNENAKFVKEMFNMIIEGEGAVNIAKYLNSMGVVPKRSNKWSGSMVRSILKRPVYCGIIQWGENTFSTKMKDGKITKKSIRNKEYIKIDGKHEPIVSKEIFNEAQKIMRSNYRSKVPNSFEIKNPFSGLIICGYCLEHDHIIKHMKRRPPQNKKSKNGKKYYASKEAITCNNIGCKNVSSLSYIVEEKLIESLKQILKEHKEYINNYEMEYQTQKKDNTNMLNYLNKEIDKNKKQLNKAQEFYELGDYTRKEFLERKEQLNKQYENNIIEKEKIEKEINNNKIEIIKQQIPKLENCINNYYNTNDIQLKNQLLKSIIDKIIYYKEKNASHDKSLLYEFTLDIKLKI